MLQLTIPFPKVKIIEPEGHQLPGWVPTADYILSMLEKKFIQDNQESITEVELYLQLVDVRESAVRQAQADENNSLRCGNVTITYLTSRGRRPLLEERLQLYLNQSLF